MGGEDGGDLRLMALEIEQSHAGGPLVEVSHNMACGTQMSCELLNNYGRGHCESARLLIVAIGVQRVYTIFLPHLAVDLIKIAD